MGTEHPDYHARFAAKAWRPFGRLGSTAEPAAVQRAKPEPMKA